MKNDCYKNANQYDHILKMFTAPADELRPALHYINPTKEFAYATNAHAAIKVPIVVCGAKYYPVEKFPDVSAVFSMHKPEDQPGLVVKTRELFNELFKIEVSWEIEQGECPQCHGEGEYECSCCGNDADCKNCDGEGVVPSTRPQSHLEVDGSDIVFNKRSYKYSYLHRIAMAALIIGSKEIEVINDQSKTAGVIFKFDQVEVLLMPKFKPE